MDRRGSAAPTVSVITPTYAHARYVRECLESVVAQTFEDWELILVDDGSPDTTVDEARRVTDSRIRIIERDHVGIERLAETYNAALALCSGTYVGIVEGDDRWSPDKLALQVEIMRQPDIVVTYARYATIGAHGRRTGVPPLSGPVRSGPFDALGPLLLDPFLELETTLIRRDALERIGGFRQLAGHRHVDYATFLALAERGRFFASDRVVAEWRRHAASFTVRAASAPWNFEGPRLCMRLALEVRRAHPRSDLPSEREIVGSWSRVLARRYWHGGRVLQAQGQWSQARDLFLSGLRIKAASLRQRAMLAAGVVASLLRIDLERVARLVRRSAPLSDL